MKGSEVLILLKIVKVEGTIIIADFDHSVIKQRPCLV